MAKVKIMPRDEDKLIDAMKMFADALEDVGVGRTLCLFEQNGDMTGRYSVDKDTELTITVSNDGDKKIVEYKYE